MPDVFPGLPTRDACPRPRTWERQSMRRPLFQNAVQRLSDQTVAFSFEGVLLNEVIDRSVQYVDGRCISCGRNVCSGRIRACVCIFQIRTRSCRLRWMRSGRRGWWRRRWGKEEWSEELPITNLLLISVKLVIGPAPPDPQKRGQAPPPHTPI